MKIIKQSKGVNLKNTFYIGKSLLKPRTGKLNSQTVSIEKRLVLIIKVWTSRNKAQLISKFTDFTPNKKKLVFLASLLDGHVSPKILEAEVRRRLR